jgi:hypothetical protein
MWRSLWLRLGEAAGGNYHVGSFERSRSGELDQFAASSDIVLGDAVAQKNAPSPAALEDRDRRSELRAQQSLTAAFFGDPLPGRSALDRRRAEQARITRQSEVWSRNDR